MKIDGFEKVKYNISFSQGKWHDFIKIMKKKWEKVVKSIFWTSKCE